MCLLGCHNEQQKIPTSSPSLLFIAINEQSPWGFFEQKADIYISNGEKNGANNYSFAPIVIFYTIFFII